MSMENVKTIVLINLVVISLFLTFNLWTYVPDSTSMQNAKFVQGMREILKRKSLMLSALLLSLCIKIKIITGAKEGDIESIYRTLEAGELHEFKEISIAKADFLSYVHGEGKLNLFSLPTSHLMQLNLCLV